MMRHFGLKAAALAAGIMLIAASHASAQCTHNPLISISNAGAGPWTGSHTMTGTEDNTINSAACTGCFFSGHNNQREVVFSFVAPTSGLYVVDTLTSTLGGADTKLWIFTNCASPAATNVANNDDISGSNFLSSTPATLTAGTTYFIMVEGWNSTTAGETAVVNIAFAPPPPANDTCAGATVIATLPFNDGLNLGFANHESTDNSASVTAGGGLGRDVFYAFTPTTTGDYRYACGGTAGTVDVGIGIFTGACGSLTEIAAVDDFNAETLFTTLTSGTAYTFIAEGYNAATTGTIGVVLSGPVAAATSGGDACASAIPVATVPFTDAGIDMSRNANWLNWGGITYAGDRTYSFTAPTADTFRFTVTPVTSTFDPMLIGLANNCGTLALFCPTCAADNTGAGQADYMDMAMTAGQVGIVVFQDFTGAGGTADFNIQVATSVPNWSEM